MGVHFNKSRAHCLDCPDSRPRYAPDDDQIIGLRSDCNGMRQCVIVGSDALGFKPLTERLPALEASAGRPTEQTVLYRISPLQVPRTVRMVTTDFEFAAVAPEFSVDTGCRCHELAMDGLLRNESFAYAEKRVRRCIPGRRLSSEKES